MQIKSEEKIIYQHRLACWSHTQLESPKCSMFFCYQASY